MHRKHWEETRQWERKESSDNKSVLSKKLPLSMNGAQVHVETWENVSVLFHLRREGVGVCIHLPCPHLLRAFLEDAHSRCCDRPCVQAGLPSPASDRAVRKRHGHGASAEVQWREKGKGCKSDSYIYPSTHTLTKLCIAIQNCFSLNLNLSKQFTSNFPWNSGLGKQQENCVQVITLWSGHL